MYKIPLTVFLSSTIRDLFDLRGGIAHFIEKDLGLRLFASEHPAFPIESSADTLRVCLRNVSISDIVILVIDKNYGCSIPSDSADSIPISFTRQEYRTAKQHRKPIFVFVRGSTIEGENRFRNAIQSSLENGRTLGTAETNAILRQVAPDVESPFVFDFLAEIRGNKEWLREFRDTNDLLDALKHRLSNILQEFRPLSGVTYHFDRLEQGDELTSVPANLIDRSRNYRATNLDILRLGPAPLDPISITGLQRRLRLGELRARSVTQFATFQVRSTLSAGETGRRLLVVDSSMETLGPNTWHDDVHQQIVGASRRASSQYGLRGERYSRISVLFNPSHYLSDIDHGVWRSALARHIQTHRDLKIKLGIVLHSALAPPSLGAFFNYYVIPGSRLEIFDVATGVALGYTPENDKQICSTFDDLFDYIHTLCDEGTLGFWIEDHLTVDDVIGLIAQWVA